MSIIIPIRSKESCYLKNTNVKRDFKRSGKDLFFLRKLCLCRVAQSQFKVSKLKGHSELFFKSAISCGLQINKPAYVNVY